MNPHNNPWIDMNDALAKGIWVVEENLSAYNAHQSAYPGLSPAETYSFTADNMLGQQKEYKFYYGQVTGEK